MASIKDHSLNESVWHTYIYKNQSHKHCQVSSLRKVLEWITRGWPEWIPLKVPFFTEIILLFPMQIFIANIANRENSILLPRNIITTYAISWSKKPIWSQLTSTCDILWVRMWQSLSYFRIRNIKAFGASSCTLHIISVLFACIMKGNIKNVMPSVILRAPSFHVVW